MARGPGPVYAVHRILIVSGLVCALCYVAWELANLARTGERLALVRAGIGLVVAAVIAVYLRSLRGLREKLTPRA